MNGLRSCCKSNVAIFTFLFSVIVTLPLIGLNAQNLEVSGTIYTEMTPVQNALVTFIDNSDTSKQFSAVTNEFGEYSISITTSINQDNTQPSGFELQQNYPNPFSASTAITYDLNRPVEVQVTIYDLLGREVKQFAVGAKRAGRYQVVWNGLNDIGQKVAAGVYFYRLRAGNETAVKKMVYGAGVGNSTISIPPNFSTEMSQVHTKPNFAPQQSEYLVRVENTENTVPVILPMEYNNITVENGASLDFTVSTNVAIIALDSTRQIIRGFGAANIVGWRPDMTTSEIEKAFGTGPGQLGFSILRLRIPPYESGFSSNLPSAQAAHDMGVTIIASPWTPPANMKTNNNTVGGRLREDAYDDFAAYLGSFADYMDNNGVPIYAVSVQNEPDVDVQYESCDWNGDEMLQFMKENADDVGVPVFAPESYHFDHALSDPTLNDPTAASNLAFVGGHIYGGGLEPYPLAEEKGKEVWMTEHLDTDVSWEHVLGTGKEINDCMNAGMSAYIWWYIVRFYGPIGDGEQGSPDGGITKRGYVMSQYSRFIRPGYYRVGASEMPQSNIYISAYTGEEKTVIVAINKSQDTVEQEFLFQDGVADSFTPYVTSQSENADQKEDILTSDGGFTATLPASSITTFVSN